MTMMRNVNVLGSMSFSRRALNSSITENVRRQISLGVCNKVSNSAPQLESHSLENYFCPSHLENIKSILGPIPNNSLDVKWKYKGKSIQGHASVLVPLCKVDNDASILFTVRSSSLTHHGGEICFPGGKMDDVDNNNVVRCALRESNEEIGISTEAIDILGTLAAVPSKDLKFAVHPVIGYCGDIDPLSMMFNPDEVSEVFHVTIKQLCDPRIYSSQPRERGSVRFVMPEYNVDGHRIWGLTAYILDFVLKIIAPDLYSSDSHPVKYSKL